MTALSIGAAPRQLGKIDACILSPPNFGISRIFLGMIKPYATTIKTWASTSERASSTDSVLRFVGWKTSSEQSVLKRFTGFADSLRPLPLARSGWVIMSSGLNLVSTSCSRTLRANSGLPAKTTLRSDWLLLIMRFSSGDFIFYQFSFYTRAFEARNIIYKNFS